ncbi:ABC transporter substrate-binding protein, partial [Cronobacter dublinensis subsp. dublinensis]|nr:ABC transporter substrate-binding protein [Cronobacter dublinensis subsp. dublinensis]
MNVLVKKALALGLFCAASLPALATQYPLTMDNCGMK